MKYLALTFRRTHYVFLPVLNELQKADQFVSYFLPHFIQSVSAFVATVVNMAPDHAYNLSGHV